MIARLRRWLAAGSLALGLSLAGASPALAWADAGHREVAEIAMANVSPATRAAIAQLLAAAPDLGTPACPVRTLADAAVWPDCTRMKEPWRWAYTFPWHFQNNDIDNPAFDPKARCDFTACAPAQIERNRRLLAERDLPVAQRLEALAYVTHFIGDLHQPLHAADHDNDHGGNNVVVSWPGHPHDTLHGLWDLTIAERAIATAPTPLVRVYTPAERAAIATGTPQDWARESWQIARDVVYPAAFGHMPAAHEAPPADITVSDAEITRLAPVARQRLVQAGLRLARELDGALGG